MGVEIHPTAIVSDNAEIGENVKIGPYAIISDEVKIGDNTIIKNNVFIDKYVEIGNENDIFSYVVIGSAPQDLKFEGEKSFVKIGNKNMIREFVTINRGTHHGGEITEIGDGNLLMCYSHVAHDCKLGSNIVLANSVNLGGHVEIYDNAILGGITAVHQFTRIGKFSIVGGMSRIRKDVVPFASVASKAKTKVYGVNNIGLNRNGFDEIEKKNIHDCFKILFRKGYTLKKALNILKENFSNDKNIQHIIQFITDSQRGIHL